MHSNRHLDPRAAVAHGEPNSFKFEIRTIFIALRCWWKIALPLGVLFAAAAGSVVYYLFEPTYTASTWLFIQERPEQLLPSGGDESHRFVANQIELMKSPLLLTPIAAKGDVRSTPELAPAQDPFVALSKRLNIRTQGQSEYFVIEFSSKDPQKAALIVTEVVEAYVHAQGKNESERIDLLLTNLKAYETKRADEVHKLRDECSILARSMNVPDPLAEKTSVRDYLRDDPLLVIQTQLFEEESKAFELKIELQTAEEFFKNNPVAVPEDELVRALAEDEAIAGLQAKIKAASSKVADFDAKANKDFKLKSPEYKLRVEERDRLQEELKTKTEERRQALSKEFAGNIARQRDSELSKLSGALSIAEQKVARLVEAKDQARQKRQESNTSSVDLKFKMLEYDQAMRMLSVARDKIDAIQTNRTLNSARVRWPDQKVAVPQMPDELVPYKSIGLFAGAAFFIPLGLAIAWEHFFRRVNSRQQLETTGTLMVVGEITSLPRRTRRNATGKVSRDLQLFEESVDCLRTYLTLVDTLQGLRALAVTSATSREGKTSVAAQLAVSIAAATGQPTLLIDGDLRSPDIHRVFGVDLSPGLAEVLAGDLSDEEAIETDFNQTLHLMTAGKLVSSPHRLLGNGEFRALLERLRGIYRYIIIDTPPLLPASEALILSRAADAAILSVRRDFSRLDQVTEAYSRLRSAGVSFAGVVLNGIPTRHYAYKYGSYDYRRQVAGDE